MGGIVHISDPYIQDEGQSFSSGILKLNDVEISVKPETYKAGAIAAGPVLPIIPLGTGNDFDRQSHNLKVILQFETTSTEITIIPSKTVLNINGKQIWPNKYSGILSTPTHLREAEKAPPGHNWTCVGINRLEMNNEAINKPHLIKEKTCIELEYPIITPEPDVKFSISIKGLLKNMETITIPTFFFKSGTTGVILIMG